MMKNKRGLRKYNRILTRVRKWCAVYKDLSDSELAALTDSFKKRIEKGESLNRLLPEAFAAVCEADGRVLGKYPYDVQILGAIVLHMGCMAQMNTGEGKTLVATMPLYLNALTGKSTFLVTTNGYLASRDAEEMGRVYRFMGLTVAVAGKTSGPDEQLTNEVKKKIYNSDIVYTTNGTLGFDYLFNNLVTSAEDKFLREFYYAIIDEADAVLLDSATTPLVVSGSPRVQSNLYSTVDFFVRSMEDERDYEEEEGSVWLTEEGIRRAESFFGVPNLYTKENFDINRHTYFSLRAHKLMKCDKDYMINRKGELVLLDGSSGRMMNGVKLSRGQHQAIEVKEGLSPSQETRSMASVTYQNLFLMFPKLAGMSGTLTDAKDELKSTYGVKTVVIPPNHELKRMDMEDHYYRTAEEQLEEAVREMIRIHRNGQPVLCVVANIDTSVKVSQMLIAEKIPHNLLNAGNANWEADMIKEAGQKNAVTVATSMAGRGTDIKLGEGVAELGGLAVIGIGRMENIRVERQARGRAGRQGDPGISRFYVSPEDETVKNSLSKKQEKKIKKYSMRRIKRLILKIQSIGEEQAEGARKNAFEYDTVLQKQRSIIYAMRDNLMAGGTVDVKTILKIAEKAVRNFLKGQKKVDSAQINRFLLDNVSYELTVEPDERSMTDIKSIRRFLVERVAASLKHQEDNIGNYPDFARFVRIVALKSIDAAWVEQVDYLQQLKSAVAGRSLAQRNPLYEYQVEARNSFEKMEQRIYLDMTRNILLSSVSVNNNGELNIVYP